MTTSAPVREVVNIPIVKPKVVPKHLPPGELVPMVPIRRVEVVPVVVRR